jgi:hypothetical protein
MWTESGESLMKAWAEKGTCMAWMHSRASAKARREDRLLTLPVIALSSATAVVGTTVSTRLETSPGLTFAMTAMSLVSAVCGAAAKVYKSAERAEEFRSGSLAWGRFARRTRLLLGLSAEERGDMRTALERAKVEYDSLSETYPFVPRSVVRQFEAEFADYKGARPDVTSGPVEVIVN